MNGYGYGHEYAPMSGGIGNGNGGYSLTPNEHVVTIYSKTPPSVDDLFVEETDQPIDTNWLLYVSGLTGIILTGAILLSFAAWKRQSRIRRKTPLINPMSDAIAPRKTIWTNNDTLTTFN